MQTKILVLVNWHIVRTKTELAHVYPYNQFVEGANYYYVNQWPIEKTAEVRGTSNSYFTRIIERKFFRFYILQTLGIIYKIQKYDIIISHGAQSGLFLALIRTLLGLKKAKHVIIDIGGFQSAGTNRFVNKIISFAIRSVDKFIVHSSSIIEYYKEHFPEIVDRSKFIKVGIDIDFLYKTKINLNISPKNEIICFGYKFRDWDTLINAFNNLNRNDLKLKIIGITNIKTKNKNIEVLPYMPIDELVQELLNCKFVVIPLFDTVYSQGQLSVLEPMVLGKTVITSDVMSITEYINDGETGLLYEKQNVNSLTEKMKLLLDNPELTKKIGENARMFVENELNFKKMQLEMFSFITEN